MSVRPKVFMAASAVAALAMAMPVGAAGAQDTHSLSASRAVLSPPSAFAGATFARSAGDPVIPSVNEARQLTKDGKFKEARTAYNVIIDNAHIRGEYPREALEDLANLKYTMEDVRGAALAFEALGGEAEVFADPATELDARYKAALLFQETHDRRAVALQMPRIKQLLKSPAIAWEKRETIARKIPS